MRYGFVKCCAATVKVKVADVKHNVNEIISAIKESYNRGCGLVVFPELSISGYTCGDLFGQTALLNAVEEGLARVKEATSGESPLVFLGAPLRFDGRLYNCAVAISCGKILGAVPKTYLPNYGEFYERRNFSPAPEKSGVITLCGESVPFSTELIFRAENNPEFSVAAEICEDLWAPCSPSVRHATAGANVIVNLSCSDETIGKAEYRRDLVKMQSGKLVCAYIYSDAGDGESTTDMAFAGHNIIAENGTVLAERKLFDNGLIFADIDVELLSNERRRIATGFYGKEESRHTEILFKDCGRDGEFLRRISKTPFVPADDFELTNRTELVLSIQCKGLEKRLSHTGAKTAVIGISGGLDSALALLVTCRAFENLGRDKRDIIAVSMPGFGTTGKTKNNATMLVKALGVTGRTVPIQKSVNCHFADIGHNKEDLNVTYENAQARMRTMILMDIANESGGLVIGTGDLSELALGWATYNGDHMSMYGVNASVPKTLVKHLIAYEAKRLQGKAATALNGILNTEISPELLPPTQSDEIAQKTEDLVGPYILHDFFLYYCVRWGFSPEKIRYLALKAFEGDFDGNEITKWLKNFYKRFFAQQFKRSCLPDGVKVGSVTLSPRGDWRMPSDAVAAVWLEDINKL